MGGAEAVQEGFLEGAHLVDGDVPHEAAGSAVEDGHLLAYGHGAVLRLDEQLVVLAAFVQGQFGNLVHVRGELGEGLQFRPLGLVYLEGTGHFFHGLDLGAATHTGYGDTHVDGGTHTLVEEALLQVNLTVGDGYHVGRDIGRYVTRLRLDDGQGGEGTAAAYLVLERSRKVIHLFGHFLLVDDARGALQQTAVEIENIAGVCLTTGGTAQDKGHLTVRHSLLGKVVVHHQSVTAGVAEILANGRSGKGGVVLQSRRIRSRRSHHHGVVHGPVLPQGLHDGSHGRSFLADGHVNAEHRISGLVGLALVDDGVDGNGGLTRLAVSDDELTLTTADGNHGIDGLEARLQRFAHRLAEDDARSLALQRHVHLVPVDGAQAVQRIAQRVNDAPRQLIVDPDGRDAARAAHHHTFLHLVRGAHEHGAHIVHLQVHDHGHEAVAAVQQFAGLGMVQSVDSHYTVTYLQGFANLLELEIVLHVLELPEQDIAHFTGLQTCSHR